MKTIVDYASKVKEQHALNKTLAPVETDLTDASRDYAIGEQFIYDGDLFKAKTAIAEHDALVLGTNYEASDDITTQIKNKTVTTDPVPTEGSTNPVQSNGVFVENRNIYKVMGKMGAKAILPMSLADIKAKNTTGTWNNNAYAINGVTYTVNTDSDGFITDIAATGTASADATLMVYGYSYTSSYAVTYDTPVIASIDFVGSDSTARGIVWGTNSSYIEATEVQIPAGTIYGFGLRVLNGYEIPVGGITFKPMIRFASDTDATYQPYVKTNKELTAENEALTKEVAATLNTLGAKNFLETLIGSGTTQGVTYTINADGSITLNGTCTAWTNIKLDYIAGQKNIPSGSYILNGSISGNNKFRLNTYVDGTKMAESENGNEASFTIPSTATEVYTRFEIDSTATFNNETFYPMIRLSSIEDDTYAPYAKTNRELTAENQTLTNNADVLIENGAINNLPSEAVTTTVTTDGANLTFTVNDDKSVIVNGTNGSSTVRYPIFASAETPQTYKAIGGKGPYKISGANNGSASTYFLVFQASNSTSGAHAEAHDLYDGEEVIGDYSYYRCYIVIKAGATVNNVKFEPMMASPSYSGGYVPYAMTNRELTPTLLWSNSAPTSDFAGQSVTLSQAFTNFKFLEIFYAQNDGAYQGSIKVKTRNGGSFTLKDYVLTTSLAQLRTRIGVMNDINKISFVDAYVCNLSSGATVGTLNNTVCIPLEVYGIK